MVEQKLEGVAGPLVAKHVYGVLKEVGDRNEGQLGGDRIVPLDDFVEDFMRVADHKDEGTETDDDGVYPADRQVLQTVPPRRSENQSLMVCWKFSLESLELQPTVCLDILSGEPKDDGIDEERDDVVGTEQVQEVRSIVLRKIGSRR